MGLLPISLNLFYIYLVILKVLNDMNIHLSLSQHPIVQELSKVTWPTRKETTITTGMVFLMVFLAATFFFVVDLILGGVVRLVLGLGG